VKQEEARRQEENIQKAQLIEKERRRIVSELEKQASEIELEQQKRKLELQEEALIQSTEKVKHEVDPFDYKLETSPQDDEDILDRIKSAVNSSKINLSQSQQSTTATSLSEAEKKVTKKRTYPRTRGLRSKKSEFALLSQNYFKSGTKEEDGVEPSVKENIKDLLKQELETFVCCLCDNPCNSLQGLMAHKTVYHRRSKAFQCRHCHFFGIRKLFMTQ
jgi:hypothetical protein